MTDDRTIIQEEGDKLVAAEYVLGVLSLADRRQAQQRLTHDQAFAEEVAFWEERLGAFVDAVVPVASATARAAASAPRGDGIPGEHLKIVPGVAHMGLAHHLGVYETIRAWCEGSGGSG